MVDLSMRTIRMTSDFVVKMGREPLRSS